MNRILNVVERNVHEVRVDEQDLVFHIPSSALFAADRITREILDALRKSRCTADELIARLAGSVAASEVAETLDELRALEIVSDGALPVSESALARAGRVARTALDTIILNVNTGCNLSCTYCYKADLDVPSAGHRMSFETARASIEMLLSESPHGQRYTLVFFGGEPLSNRTLIERVVEYCETRFAGAGKAIEFVMTTNATPTMSFGAKPPCCWRAIAADRLARALPLRAA